MDDLENTETIKLINKYRGSLLVIEAENDQIIPQELPKTYFINAEAVKIKEYMIIKGASHDLSSPEAEKEFKEAIADWFAKTL